GDAHWFGADNGFSHGYRLLMGCAVLQGHSNADFGGGAKIDLKSPQLETVTSRGIGPLWEQRRPKTAVWSQGLLAGAPIAVGHDKRACDLVTWNRWLPRSLEHPDGDQRDADPAHGDLHTTCGPVLSARSASRCCPRDPRLVFARLIRVSCSPV